MKVMVTNEYRFFGGPDGTVWTAGQFRYSYFTRYLDVFDQVVVAARVNYADSISPAWQSADGPNVSFVPLPHYIGPIQFALHAHKVHRMIGHAVRSTDAAILRAPGIISDLAERAARKYRRPYGLEIVTDPAAIFSRGVVDHPLRPLFRWYSLHRLRRQCRNACAAAYLTRNVLQTRYPPGPDVFQTSYPEVELRDDAFAPTPVCRNYGRPPFTLVTVGSLAQLYKGIDVLLKAFKRCLQNGLDVRLVLIGDGRYRADLEALTAELRLAERVVFMGQLPSGQAIRDQLDQAHLFVLPSRTEGMPSAMIEAMARGLPCIGSAVGGIPELVPPEDLVPPGDVENLAAKIRGVLTDPDRMERMAARNLERAWQYHEDALRKLRREFYRYIKEKQPAWAAGGRGAALEKTGHATG